MADGEFEIWMQRINAATGAEIGANDVRISDAGGLNNATYDATLPSIAYNSTNNQFLVSWQADDSLIVHTNDELEIIGQRIDTTIALPYEVGANDFRVSDMGPNGNANYDAQSPSVECVQF